MKLNSKTVLLAISSLSIASVPAVAGTITSPMYGTPVTATGTITRNYANIPQTIDTCNISLSGYVESVGGVDKITFTSENSNCGSINLPFSLNATSSSQVTSDIYLSAPIGPCGYVRGVSFSWSGSTATRSTTFSAGPCNVTFFDLTISPTVTII